MMKRPTEPSAAANKSDRGRIVPGLLLRMRPLRVFLLFLLSMTIAFLLSPRLMQSVGTYRLGQFTTGAIRAPYDFSVTDDAATERKRDEAARSTVPVADYDSGMAYRIQKGVQEAFQRIAGVFQEAEAMESVSGEELRNLSSAKRKALIEEQRVRAGQYLKEKLGLELPAFENALGVSLTGYQRDTLVRGKFGESLAEGVSALIRDAYSQPVAENTAAIQQEVEGNPGKGDGPGKLALRDTATGVEKTLSDLSVLRTPKELEPLLSERAPRLLPDLNSAQRTVAVQIAAKQVKANLTLNIQETEARRLAAREAGIPVSYTFKKNQLILGEGQEVTEQKLLVLAYLHAAEMPRESILRLLGSGALLFMLLLIGIWVADLNVERFKLSDKDFVFVAASLVVFVLLFRIWLFVVNELIARHPGIPPLALVLLFPVGLMAMQTRLLLGFELAILQSAIIAFLSRMLAALNLPFGVYTFLVCVVAAHMVAGCSRRSAVLRAGLWVSGVSVAGAACLVLLSENTMDRSFLIVLACAGFGGLLTGFGVVALSPLAEWAFGYTTDIKLLEMSNYENPLLKRLMSEAPGTFQHSINIGVLAETAAKTIGANALLVRVGALLHDVGKSNNPKMFIENQSGSNPHDLLSPEESARIIRAHVVEGVKLVREHGLGERIVDFVVEHHGTGRIKYFLEKAREANREVNLAEFTYPGPKPHLKETGILMIADQVEATSRALENRNEQAFREMILRTISRIHEEGQLDECPLTLKDLAAIQEALLQALMGIHHDRIRYPEQTNGSFGGSSWDDQK
jgi:cyclic-di-AMP phosphodiesterase PgpH